MKHVIFDSETTGRYDFKSDPWAKHQPYLVQLAAAVYDDAGQCRAKFCAIVNPAGWTIPEEVAAIHGITTAIAQQFGLPLLTVLESFEHFTRGAGMFVAHNKDFDVGILGTAYYRTGRIDCCPVNGRTPLFCTMKAGAPLTKIPGQFGDYKWPKLSELHKHLFGFEHSSQHDALGDVEATARCYFAMKPQLQATH